MPGKCSATKLHTHPRHRRERQFPGPAAKYGPRILLQSGGEVGSHYCSHPLLPSLQGPSSLRAGASQGPLPRGRLPASLMNFSLLSRVQSFLQVLTATLIFSPFCNGSICSRTLPHLEGVPFPNPQHDRCGTGYHPREGRWCSPSMAPHPCLPHTPFFFYLCPSSPPLSLPSGPFCVRTRKGFRDQKAQSLCTDEDTQSHYLSKASRYMIEHTGSPSEESRASFSVLTVGFQPYCLLQPAEE